MTEVERNILDLIRVSATMGAAEAMRRLEPKSDQISQREAEAEFGKPFVHECIVEGLVTCTRHGKTANSKKTLSRAELEKVRSARDAHLLKVKIQKETVKS